MIPQHYTNSQDKFEEKFVLLRQALAGDERAWTDFYHFCNLLMLSWAGRWIKDPGEVEEVALRAWEKFAQAMSLQKLANFQSFPQIMGYLQQCAFNTAKDYLRSKRNITTEIFVPVEQMYDLADERDDFADSPSYPELVQFVLQELSNNKEQLLFKLLFVYKWVPAEIAKQYPIQFCSVTAVYNARRRMMQKLRRNKALRALFEGKEEYAA